MRRRDEVLVGVLVTVGLLIGIGGTLWLARKGFGGTYALNTRFKWGAGLKQGQQVSLAGVAIGAVDKVTLRPDGYLDVRMKIEKQYPVPEGSTARVLSIGIFGDKEVSLDPKGPNMTPFQPGDTVPAGPIPPSMDDILARVDTLGRGVSDITKAIQIEMVQAGGLQDLRRSIGATNRLIEQLGAIANEQSRGLSQTMTSVRRSLSGIDSARVDSTLHNMETVTANFAALSADLQGTKTRLDSILYRLDHGDGTAAKFLNDPKLYDDLRHTLNSADSLMTDIRKNPKKYINVRVF